MTTNFKKNKIIAATAIFVFLALGAAGFYIVRENRTNVVVPGQLKITKVGPEKYSFKTLDNNLIEIGKGSNGQPVLKLNKLDGEVSMTIDFPSVAGARAEFDGQKLTYSNGSKTQIGWWKKISSSNALASGEEQPKVDVVFYPKQKEQVPENNGSEDSGQSTINEQGGVEFDTILYSRPETNVISYPIKTDGLAFYYQPALNQEKQEKGISCSETVCRNEQGQITVSRPENIVNSYAVYYSGRRSGDYTQAGGKNYMAGKAFHIYRPEVVDSAGSQTWGKINIDTGSKLLTIEVDQAWLDKAVYPVTIDPNFGYDTAGASDFWRNANTYSALKVESPIDANGATVSKMSVYCKQDYSSSTLNYKGVVAGPDKIILSNGITGEAVVNADYTWVDSSFNTAPGIIDNVSYFLGAIPDVGSSNFAVAYDLASSNIGLSDFSNNYSAPTNPTDGVLLANRFSIYAVYSGGSASPDPSAYTVSYNASSSYNVGSTNYNSAAVLDSGHVVIAYEDGNPGLGNAVIATVTGTTTIAYSAEYNFGGNGSSYISAVALDATHVFIAYNDGDNSSYGTGRVGTISGNTITYGAEYVFENGTASDLKVSKLSSTKVFLVYDYNNSSIGIVADITGGNIIAYGADYPFYSGGNNTALSAEALDSTHILTSYQRFGSTGSALRAGIVTGNTVSYGTETEFYFHQAFDVSIASLGPAKALVAYNKNVGDGTYSAAAFIANISGSNISSISAEQYFDPTETPDISAAAFDPGRVLIAYPGGTGGQGSSLVAGVTGNKIYFGNTSSYSPSSPSFTSAAVLDSTRALIAYSDGKAVIAALTLDASNHRPTITSVSLDISDNKICKMIGPSVFCNSGPGITFNSVASDQDAGDSIKLYVCRDEFCLDCSPTSTGGCWAYSDSASTINPEAVFDISNAPSCGGDAKWSPYGVPVDSSHEYHFQDSYISDVNTYIVEQFLDENGNLTYGGDDMIPASPYDWGNAYIDFVPPEGTISVVILHVIPEVGFLTVDNFSLTQDSDGINLFPNSDLETDSNGDDIPDYWGTDQWGTVNEAVFSYPVEGEGGGSAAETRVVSARIGDSVCRYCIYCQYTAQVCDNHGACSSIIGQ